MMSIEELKRNLKGELFTDEETRRDVETDFGRIVHKLPRAVVLPAETADVEKVVGLAARQGWSVSTRGGAHSQSGQSLTQDGILIDTTGLAGLGEIEGESIWTDAGVLWGDLVRHTAQQGLIPPVLTNNLNVTVGGTLSMAGLGVASHRYGTQADNILELEVVTGEGHRVRCSPTENAELFNCSRCGLGQFAIITRARLRLRRFGPQVRTWYLLYDDLEALMGDQEKIFHRDQGDYIESWCTPCPQGFRKVGETKMPFAEWFYPMQLTVEYQGEPPAGESVLDGLHYYRKVHVEENTLLDFLFRLEPVFALWRQMGTWKFAHPWMEVVLPWESAGSYIQGVLSNFPPNLLVGGHVLLWPARGTTSDAPLFRHPAGDLVMGFGILPAVPRQFLPMILPLLNKASDLCMQMGGKRYLSGWVDFDHQRWKEHFGETWESVLKWKKFYDPQGVLNPGFIRYQEEPQ